MADQSLVIPQKKVERRQTESRFAFALSNSLSDEGNKVSSSGNHGLLQLQNMDSTRIPGPEITDTNQDRKRRCFENLVVRTERMTEENVENVKCSLQVEVIDDTALIEATAAVSGFKNCNRGETDVGFGNTLGNVGSSHIPKQEKDGKKKRNKGSKKQGKVCSMKCVNEKKSKGQVVKDQDASDKKISEGKCQHGLRKACRKMKVVYQRKDLKDLKLVANGVEERQIVKNQKATEKIFEGTIPKTDLMSLKASNGNEKELAIQLVETQTVNEKEDGLNLNPKIDVQLKKNEAEDQNVCKNTTVGSKKIAYSREEMEALRFVDEAIQKNKWTEVYSGFEPSVAREYAGLLVDTNNRPAQRYNRVENYGSTRHAILSMPPVLPLCSSSTYKKIAPHGRLGFRVNFH